MMVLEGFAGRSTAAAATGRHIITETSTHTAGMHAAAGSRTAAGHVTQDVAPDQVNSSKRE